MPAVVIFNHSESYTQRHLSLQHARDKSSIFWPKHLHAHKCISGCGVDVKAVRSRDFDRRDFDRSRLWYTPIILGNLKVYVVKSKKSENNSAPSWVRTRALVVRMLEHRPLTCEIVSMALRLLVTWPKAWDASFSYEFVVFIFYTE